MTKCKTHKCRAQCCYNIPLPIGYLQRFADKIVNSPIETLPLPPRPDFPPSEYAITDNNPNNNKCPFLRRDCKCSIYDNRPQICRLYGEIPQLECKHIKQV